MSGDGFPVTLCPRCTDDTPCADHDGDDGSCPECGFEGAHGHEPTCSHSTGCDVAEGCASPGVAETGRALLLWLLAFLIFSAGFTLGIAVRS